MKKSPLNIAIIGCGAIFQNNHMPALLKNSKWNIRYLIDSDKNRAASFSKKLGVGYSSKIDSIPRDIDVCLIATPNFLHASQSVLLLEKGFHVVCEKPMALSLLEANSVETCATETGRLFFIVHQKRYHSNVQYLINQLISRNETINAIDISLGNMFGWQSRTNFYHSPQQSGGGVFIDLGVHLLDLLQLFGKTYNFHSFYYSVAKETNLDHAVTCFGLMDRNISITLRASRSVELTNALRVFTNSGLYQASLNNASSIIFKPSLKDLALREVILEHVQDPFYEYWGAVADRINGVECSVTPSDITSGAEVTAIIDQFREKGIVVPC